MKNFQAALDLSGAAARVTVADANGNILRSASLKMKRRESANLAEFLAGEIASCGGALTDVSHWSVGIGPGSFTGMRLAAALIAGLTHGNEAVKTRGVPTAIAISMTGAPELKTGETTAVLFDGRNQEILVFPTRRNSDGVDEAAGEGLVLNQTGAVKYFEENRFDAIVTQSNEWEAVAKIIPETVQGKVRQIEDFDLSALLKSAKEFDNNLRDLIYIRPAVFTK